MGQYVVLVNWTEEGIQAVKKAPQRAEQLRAAVDAAGGRVHSFLFTMGTYDAVAAFELPNNDVANELILRIGSQGMARTVTLKGWTAAEFAKLAERL